MNVGRDCLLLIIRCGSCIHAGVILVEKGSLRADMRGYALSLSLKRRRALFQDEGTQRGSLYHKHVNYTLKSRKT